jgi:small subunit ribosomal protein S1
MENREPPGNGLSEDYWQALLQQGEAPAMNEAGGTPASAPGMPAGPVSAPDGADAGLNGRLRSGQRRDEEQWQLLEAWHDEGRSFVAPVIGCNKGGLLVRIADGLGFVPASQLADLPRSLGTPDLRTDLEGMVGREVKLKIIEIDRSRDRVICSERATQWDGSDVDERLVSLQERIGEDVHGIVRSLCDFGVFVDLGGVDGLIHISELSWQRVSHPSDVVSLDESLQVRILNVDLEGRRVGLSLKQLFDDPWQLIASRYAVGDVIDAKITNVVHFGAFAQVDEKVEGLIHISELAESAFAYATQVVAEGQTVKVRVLHIDSKARRLGLSIRQAIAASPEGDLPPSVDAGSPEQAAEGPDADVSGPNSP